MLIRPLPAKARRDAPQRLYNNRGIREQPRAIPRFEGVGCWTLSTWPGGWRSSAQKRDVEGGGSHTLDANGTERGVKDGLGCEPASTPQPTATCLASFSCSQRRTPTSSLMLVWLRWRWNTARLCVPATAILRVLPADGSAGVPPALTSSCPPSIAGPCPA